MPTKEPRVCCSVCGAEQSVDVRLFPGVKGFVCTDCVEIYMQTLVDEDGGVYRTPKLCCVRVNSDPGAYSRVSAAQQIEELLSTGVVRRT